MRNADYIHFAGLALMIVTSIFVLWRMRHPKPKYGEILPANEMKAKYHLTADRYKPPRLDPQKVPENLRDLLPLAAKWGIPDDIIRDDFEQKASDEEKEAFKNSLTGRTAEITQWLDSFELNEPMSTEAAQFMYMLEALDEMKLRRD